MNDKKRYYYTGHITSGRVHYNVYDGKNGELINTYRQIKKAKSLVRDLNK